MTLGRTLLLLLATCVFPVTAQALSTAGGSGAGPDDSTVIDLTFTNDGSSTHEIIMMTIDGSTASNFPIAWDSYGTAVAPPGTTLMFDGEDTTLLSVGFLMSPDGFEPGESFSLFGMDADGAPGPIAPQVSDLIGVEVEFTFRDSSTWLAAFVDDPNGGVVLAPVSSSALPTPEPTSPILFACGLLAVASRLRTRAADTGGR